MFKKILIANRGEIALHVMSERASAHFLGGHGKDVILAAIFTRINILCWPEKGIGPPMSNCLAPHVAILFSGK